MNSILNMVFIPCIDQWRIWPYGLAGGVDFVNWGEGGGAREVLTVEV